MGPRARQEAVAAAAAAAAVAAVGGGAYGYGTADKSTSLLPPTPAASTPVTPGVSSETDALKGFGRG